MLPCRAGGRLLIVGGIAAFFAAGAHAQSAASAPAPAAAATAAAQAPAQHFDIWELEVTGNTLLSEEAVQTALTPYVGPDRTPDDVENARTALEKLYRDLGYKTVSVSIPAQSVNSGTIALEVTEGAIGKVNIVGGERTSRERLRSELPGLASGKVPNFEELQKQMSFANRLATRKVAPSLRAGSSPGKVDIDLNVEDQPPLHGSLEINNKHSQNTTFQRASASLGYDNLFQLGHSLNLSYQLAPQKPSEGKVFFGSYLAPIGDGSWSLLFSALKTGSNISALADVNVIGKGQSYSLKLIKQLGDIDGKLFPSVGIELGDKHFLTRTELTGLTTTSLPTPLSEYPLTLSYSQLARYTQDILQNDLSLVFPLPGSGSDTETYQISRFSANRSWFYLRGNNSLTHDFGPSLQAFVRLSGQFTDQPLVSLEQFGVGGSDSVRGYLESEVVGDYGFSGTMELRGASLPDLFPKAGWSRYVTEVRPYLFVDGAMTHLHGPFPDDTTVDHTELLSFGGGFSLRMLNYLSGSLQWAEPVYTAGSAPASTRKWHPRLLFRAAASF